MKKLLTLVCALVLTTMAMQAQDIIVMRDSNKIDAKILEVSESEIRYKESNYLDGPTYTISAKMISSITYGNGKIQRYTFPIKFQCNLELGGQIGQYDFDAQGPSGGGDFDASFGIRIKRIAFVGIGLGVHSEYVKYADDDEYNNPLFFLTMPLYVDARVYVPTSRKINPFLNVDLGGYFPLASAEYTYVNYHEKGWTNTSGEGGIFFQIGPGLEVNRFQFCVGYRMLLPCVHDPEHQGFIKVGVRLGKKPND